MDRFVRYKALQKLWVSVKRLLGGHLGQQRQDARLRYRYLQIQGGVRQTYDGVVRTTGDPDTMGPLGKGADRAAAQQVFERQRQAAKQWVEQQQRRGRMGR